MRGRGADERPGPTLWRRFKEDCLVEVSEVMTKEVVTVGPHYNVADVASLMDAKGIGSVIVDDQIVGIVSIRDVVRWSVREMAQATELPHMDVSRQVLSLVHPVDAAADPS